MFYDIWTAAAKEYGEYEEVTEPKWIAANENPHYGDDELRRQSARELERHPELKVADAEAAKQQGGMVAFKLRTSDAQNLAIPGYEPYDDLHITILFFGSSVEPGIPQEVGDACAYVANYFGQIWAKVFSRAEFNPGTEDACAVYLVGNTAQLDEVRDMLLSELRGFDFAEQHTPWIPHITIGYGASPGLLSFQGDVCIDRIQVSWAGEDLEFRLLN